MKRASIAALVAKASSEFLLDNDESEVGGSLLIYLTPEESSWINGDSKRIVLGVSSENMLKSLTFEAEIAGIQSYLIFGNLPENHKRTGSNEALCAAIGPDESDKIDKITGNLKLL